MATRTAGHGKMAAKPRKPPTIDPSEYRKRLDAIGDEVRQCLMACGAVVDEQPLWRECITHLYNLLRSSMPPFLTLAHALGWPDAQDIWDRAMPSAEAFHAAEITRMREYWYSRKAPAYQITQEEGRIMADLLLLSGPTPDPWLMEKKVTDELDHLVTGPPF